MKKEKSEPLKTVLTIVTGFGIIFLLTHIRAFLYAALIIGLAGSVSAYLAKLTDMAWMKLAQLLGLIVPNILLACIFYLVLFPLSLLAKLFKKKDALMLSGKTKSTFITVNKIFTKQSFDRPW